MRNQATGTILIESLGSLFRRLRNRVTVTRRHRFVAKHEVALGANESAVLGSLIDFVVENSTFVRSRCDVTAFSAATRFYRDCFHRRQLVTLRTLEIRMDLMSKGAC